MTLSQFIQTNTALINPPACPEIRLHLATEITPLWLATEAFLAAHDLDPPYWAFAWVGGQGLARYILDHPGRVAGRRVLDFAAGSGLGAIAAAKAGAASAEAAEIDGLALAAIALNAEANDVTVGIAEGDVLERPDGPWDMIIAGDVCYEKSMAARVFSWLQAMAARGVPVLMADPGRNYLPQVGLREVARYTVPCSLELEDRTSREVRIFEIGD